MNLSSITDIFLLLLIINKSFSFLIGSGSQISHILLKNEHSSLSMFSWFGGNEERDNNKNENSIPSSLNDYKYDNENDKKRQNLNGNNNKRSGMGSTASMMESFKKNQEIGKRTASFMDDLSSITIEGIGADGKVKVLVDGQQRPTGIEIEDEYLANVNGEDLVDAITAAMQEAHSKSSKLMAEKIQVFYGELGLP